jgi:hypothetical protein
MHIFTVFDGKIAYFLFGKVLLPIIYPSNRGEAKSINPKSLMFRSAGSFHERKPLPQIKSLNQLSTELVLQLTDVSNQVLGIEKFGLSVVT